MQLKIFHLDPAKKVVNHVNCGECACIFNNGSKTDGPYLQPSQLTKHH